MRINKILIIAVALLFMATASYALSVKSVVNNFNVGETAGSLADYEEVLMQVYNATDMPVYDADVVTWYLTNDDGRSVTKVNRLAQMAAGVIIETIAASTWGDMLVYGYHAAVKIPGAISNVTAGYGLYAYGSSDAMDTTNTTNTDDGKACAGQQTIVTGNQPLLTQYQVHTLPNKFGMALDTTTTETTVQAFINCL